MPIGAVLVCQRAELPSEILREPLSPSSTSITCCGRLHNASSVNEARKQSLLQFAPLPSKYFFSKSRLSYATSHPRTVHGPDTCSKMSHASCISLAYLAYAQQGVLWVAAPWPLCSGVCLTRWRPDGVHTLILFVRCIVRRVECCGRLRAACQPALTYAGSLPDRRRLELAHAALRRRVRRRGRLRARRPALCWEAASAVTLLPAAAAATRTCCCAAASGRLPLAVSVAPRARLAARVPRCTERHGAGRIERHGHYI